MNKRRVGDAYEDAAASYLESIGYRVLERNFRVRQGEIDIIAFDKPYLVFIEVKYRKSKTGGYAEEAVHWKKQQQIRRVALFYLMKHHVDMGTPMRFDVLAINGEEVRHIKNAF
ncbi:MAG: YraN family protein [Lachnospiraceae bacterium]|nr:YraN family protein [Lachnospiraceae bacterium]